MQLPHTPRHDRRAFFALGSAAALSPRPWYARSAARPETIEAIVEAAAELAREVARDDPRRDEAWTFAATALLAGLREVPRDPFPSMTPRETAFLDAHGWTFRRVHAARAPDARADVITHQLWIPPGGAIPLHDHRDFFGAVVCVQGEVAVRSFDIVEGTADEPVVTLRESVQAWLQPGRYSLLTRARDNVHELRAGEQGARLLDLFAWLSPQARSAELRWLDDPAARPADRRYRAAWVGK